MNDRTEKNPTGEQMLHGLAHAINWHHTGADNQRPPVSEVLDTARQFAQLLAEGE